MDSKALVLTSSPTAVSTRSGSDRWADIHDDTRQESSEEDEQDLTPRQEGDDYSPAEAEDSEADDECGEAIEGIPCEDSVGASFHDSGRCKPCAFFHTKGCKSGADCIFCHRCPPNEKQRRKRMRRQLVQALPYTSTPAARKAELRDGLGRAKVPVKAGHSRQNSNASTAATVSTAATTRPRDAEKRGLHSREWSTSTQESGGSVSPLSQGTMSCVTPGSAQAWLGSSAPRQPFQNSAANGFVPPPPSVPAPTDADFDMFAAQGTNNKYSLAPAQWGQMQMSQQQEHQQQMQRLQMHQQQQQHQQQHQQQLLLQQQRQQQQLMQQNVQEFGYSCGSNYDPSSPTWSVQAGQQPKGTITCNGQQYMLVPVPDNQCGQYEPVKPMPAGYGAVPPQVEPAMGGAWYQEPYAHTGPGPLQWQDDQCNYGTSCGPVFDGNMW